MYIFMDRHGHALTCTDNSCFLYGGITTQPTAHPIHQHNRQLLYVSSQFIQLHLNPTGMKWTSLENEVQVLIYVSC